MSHQLKYQESYSKPAHKSVINAMVFSPDGDRLITGSDDCTVLVWSTQSGSILCHIKTYTPVISIAWLTNTNGFLLGCQNGMMASVCFSEFHVKTTFFRAHNAAIYCISPRFNDTFPITAASKDVKIWTRTGKNDLQIEGWELKATLPSPSMLERHREVEVTSVNWETSDVVAYQVLVSYRWHGIICWSLKKMSPLWQLSMDECCTLSLSPDGRCVATFAPSKYFEVRELKTGVVHRMQVPVVPTSPAGRHKKQLGPIKNQPVCFAHGGFAVAGALNESQVRVWDAEGGDQLFTLDHGEGSNIRAVVTVYFDEEDKFLIATGTQKHKKNYVSLWLTVPRTGDTPDPFSGHRFELSFTRGFWVGVSLIVLVLFVVLAALFGLRFL